MTYALRLVYTFTLLLAGCAKDVPPVFVAADVPDLPAECFPAQKPAPAEPKLPLRDATDIDVVRGLESWKKVYRTEKAFRAACGSRLDALFPSGERSKPTS